MADLLLWEYHAISNSSGVHNNKSDLDSQDKFDLLFFPFG